MVKFAFHNLVRNDSLLNSLYEFAYLYRTPGNFNYFFNFGFLSLVCLIMQIITGLILSMHYVADWEYAFASVEHIMRDVNYGCFVRYLHANGASMFFFVVYIHMFKNLYYGSFMYPRRWLWVTGVIIFILMILTAFTGYVLPWGQMSFWAATVITNLCSAIPYIGTDLVEWIWGGYSVDNPTLKRFYTIHFLMPFIILALALLHITLLHHWGSNSPLGIGAKLDNRRFTPYFFVKDFSYFFFFAIFAGYFIFFMPNVLGHPDNYIPANPLVTPEHIVPEWYFLPFYAILRALPDKLLGVCALGLSLIVLLFLPFYDRASVRSFFFKPISKVFFWWFVFVCMLLMWTGAKPIESPYLLIGQISTFSYFGYLILVIPFFSELHLLYNRYRLYHPVSVDLEINNFFTTSYSWFSTVLLKKEDSFNFFKIQQIADNNNLSVLESNWIDSRTDKKINDLTMRLEETVDLDLLLELDALQFHGTIEPMILNTPSLALDIEEYKKWSGVVSYVDGILGKDEISSTIEFLSTGLDLPLSEAEYNLITKEEIDVNLYKVAKQYKFYFNILNPSISTSDEIKQSIFDTSNILCFLLEDAQYKIIKTGFDDFIVNSFQSFKRGLGPKS